MEKSNSRTFKTFGDLCEPWGKCLVLVVPVTTSLSNVLSIMTEKLQGKKVPSTALTSDLSAKFFGRCINHLTD